MVIYNHLLSELLKVEDILSRETDPDRIAKITCIYQAMIWSGSYDDPIDIESILMHVNQIPVQKEDVPVNDTV